MKVWLRFFFIAVLVLTVVSVSVSVVSAHAKLVKASPAPSSVMGTAPSQVQLWFDEPLELNFSEVQVLDANKQRVDAGTLQAVAADPNSLIVPLKPTGDGTYNVIWKVLSAADGHITRGVFAYGVGTTAGIVTAPIDVNAGASNELTPVSAIVRWLSLLSLLLIVGGFIFRYFLLERSLDAIAANANARRVVQTRWEQLIALAFILFFISSLGELFLQANLVADEVSFNSITNILINSRSGILWLLRVLLVGICAVTAWLSARRGYTATLPFVALGLGLSALYTRSLGSHAAATGHHSPQMISDWAHFVAVSTWVGGLIFFAWLMPFLWRALEPKTRSAWIARFIPHFSKVAIIATGVIAVTGLYNSIQQIPALDLLATRALPDLQSLVANFYNDALGIKIALFLVMIAFGAMNLLILSPRFRRIVTEPEKSARLFSRFRITVGAEVVLALGAIFLAGILTLTPPPRSQPDVPGPVAAPQTQRPVVLVGYPAADVQVQLEVGLPPNTPTTFTARVTDRSDQPLNNLQRVIFNFMYLNEDTGAQNITADARGDNQYVAEGNYLPLEGMWKIKVTVRRQGIDDTAVEFPYLIESETVNSDTTPVTNAQLELIRAQQRMNALTALRSRQELNDGANGVAISEYEYQAPDKTKFSIEGQGESIAIGAQQYYQDRQGQWSERARVEPFLFPSFNFADTAQSTRLGRTDKVGGKSAQIVLFNTPNTSGTEQIHYAYWIDDADKRVQQFAMVTSAHYMMQYYRDFNSADIDIAAPPNVLPAPTSAAVAEGGASPLTNAVQGSARPQGFITGDLEGDGALVLVVAGVVVLLFGSGGKRARKARVVLLGIGAAAVLLGIGLFIDAVNGTSAAAQNVPVNTARASSGQQIYVQNCAVCHGQKGYGDGPGAASLPVKPFDLTTHVLLHDEQYLHAVILNGRGYMPAFGSRLSQDQILDVIAYTRLLARQAQQNNARPGFTPQP